LHLRVKLAEIAFDKECIELQTHTLIRLVPIILKHAFEEFFKVYVDGLPI